MTLRYYSIWHRLLAWFFLKPLCPLIRLLGRVLKRPSGGPGERLRILVQDGYQLGDLILVTPALARLRRVYPDAEITLMGGTAGKSLMAACGIIDAYLAFEMSWFDRRGLVRKWQTALGMARALRLRRFSLAFDTRGDSRGLLVLWLAGIPETVSLSDFSGACLCTHAYVTPQSYEHQLKRSLFCVNAWLNGKESVTEVHPVWPGKAVVPGATTLRPGHILIHPFTANPKKLWPFERWAAVACWLIGRGCPVTLTGAPSEKGRLTKLKDACGGDCRVAILPIDELAGLVRSAELVLCLDSFIQHVAWTQDSLQLVLYGPSNPHYTAPFNQKSAIVWNDRVLKPPYRQWQGPVPMESTSVAGVTAALEALVPKPGGGMEGKK